MIPYNDIGQEKRRNDTCLRWRGRPVRAIIPCLNVFLTGNMPVVLKSGTNGTSAPAFSASYTIVCLSVFVPSWQKGIFWFYLQQ